MSWPTLSRPPPPRPRTRRSDCRVDYYLCDGPAAEKTFSLDTTRAPDAKSGIFENRISRDGSEKSDTRGLKVPTRPSLQRNTVRRTEDGRAEARKDVLLIIIIFCGNPQNDFFTIKTRSEKNSRMHTHMQQTRFV